MRSLRGAGVVSLDDEDDEDMGVDDELSLALLLLVSLLCVLDGVADCVVLLGIALVSVGVAGVVVLDGESVVCATARPMPASSAAAAATADNFF